MSSAENHPNDDLNLPSLTFDELITLADTQHALYQRHPDGRTLDLAIHYYSATFGLDGPIFDTKVDYLLSYFRLHHPLLLRAQMRGDCSSNGEAKILNKVLRSTPLTHHLRPVLLGSSPGNLDTPERVGYYPATHPQRVRLLMQYGTALQSRYTALQDKADLNLAIQQFEVVLKGCPTDLIKPARVCLAIALDYRYKLHYDINDVNLAIEAHAAVIDMLQQESMEYIFVCVRYSLALVTLMTSTLPLCMPRSSLRGSHRVMNNTSLHPSSTQISSSLIQNKECLFKTSTQQWNVSVAAWLFVRWMILPAAGYSVLSAMLSVSLHSESLLDGGARAGHLNHLASALFIGYQLQGDKADSDRARTYLQEALQLCPLGHANRLAILNNYARTLGHLAKEASDISDLNLSIKYYYEAVEHCYASARSTLLTNLTFALLSRHSLLGDLGDLEVAISLGKTALELQPENHLSRGRTFLFQAKAVIATFPQKSTTVLADTEIALDILHAARDTFALGHPLLIETYRELSNMYFLQHTITNSDGDLEEAFNYRIAATEYSNGGSRTMFEAAMEWVEAAERFYHSSLLDAYRSTIRILNLHFVLKPSLDLRHDIIKTRALSICADATSCALRSHDIVGAVEIFERSRCLFWAYMARLRTPLDELRASGPSGQDLADEFERLSHQLEISSFGDDGEHGQQFRRVQKDWNTMVDKIRAMDGFGKFLLPPLYDDLRVAAIAGPVIILNPSRHSCDAIVVLADAEPIDIAYQEGTFSEIVTMSSKFNRIRKNRRRKPEDDLNNKDEQKDEKALYGLLRRLWDSVVREVVLRLEPHIPKNSRIWWCPTGVFTSLPIHAASPYRKGQPGLSGMYTSSYTPTLSALIRSRNKQDARQGVPSFVSIGQHNSAGHTLLRAVRSELDLVQKLLPQSIPLTELADGAATRDAALTALSMHTYAYLACHGKQVPERPYESYFAMRDGHLTLLDILHSQLGQETEFAFLSACKTTMGDENAPNEVVHLAAALQFAGVRNVVGTMWSVDDEVVNHTVEAFYRAMVREDGVFDPSRAAEALRTATKAAKGQVPLEQEIVFIHIGI